ncbi:hypothetical protein [Desulfatibacillum aliphaticivorans]|uniref:hypothetical protein n=1 Tax=Desulfatibacillum aliphaticivorans TaxID=218208 RepID=UPI000488530A|nr:hypothetical protein [Desulfatibacillum aliphaticivorans]
MTRKYPENTFQHCLGEWWEEDEGKDYCRGRLVRVFIPHVDQTPSQMIPTGREEPTNHEKAQFKISPLRTHQQQPSLKLPVAAMPAYPGEVRAVYRAKLRPALIVGREGKMVERTFRQGKPKWQTAPTILVAPYYGADEGEKRSGFKREFLLRICAGEYPQFVWDSLPIGSSTDESILRLDHIQPVGAHHDSINLTQFRLSEQALEVIDEWIRWLLWGGWKKDSYFDMIRTVLMDLPG